MEDRFLFRGKGKDDGIWYIGDLSHIAHKCYIYTTPVDGGVFNIRVDPATVGQCVGLKDKNGRLIFEGDICKDSLGWIFTVVWDNECSRFIGKHDKRRGDTYICYIGREPIAVEIIGNIHDTANQPG